MIFLSNIFNSRSIGRSMLYSKSTTCKSIVSKSTWYLEKINFVENKFLWTFIKKRDIFGTYRVLSKSDLTISRNWTYPVCRFSVTKVCMSKELF